MSKDIFIIFAALIVFSVGVYVFNMEAGRYETVVETYTSKVVKLHERQEPINRYGNFKNVYEILLEDGSVREVELKVFLTLREGEYITWQESHKKLK